MEKFSTHTGVGAPLRRSNVDTDQIIPAVWLKKVTRDGFEEGLFSAWRNDPSFVLNQDAYKYATVVVQRLWYYLDTVPGALITVDLESRTVKAGEGVDAIEDSFTIDDYTRWRLLNGLDDVGITLSHEDDIIAYEATRPSFKPVTL